MDYFNNKRNLVLVGFACLEYLLGLIISSLIGESLHNTWLAAYVLLAISLTLYISFHLYTKDLKTENKKKKAMKFKIASWFCLAGVIISFIGSIIKTYEKFFI